MKLLSSLNVTFTGTEPPSRSMSQVKLSPLPASASSGQLTVGSFARSSLSLSCPEISSLTCVLVLLHAASSATIATPTMDRPRRATVDFFMASPLSPQGPAATRRHNVAVASCRAGHRRRPGRGPQALASPEPLDTIRLDASIASKLLPGMRRSVARSSFDQRGSGTPERNQAEPLSALIAP